jgi:hypothetical protein
MEAKKKGGIKSDKNGKIYINIRNFQKWRIEADYLNKIPVEDRNFFMKVMNEWIGGSFNYYKIHNNDFYKRKLEAIKNNSKEYEEFLENYNHQLYLNEKYNVITKDLELDYNRTVANRANQVRKQKQALKKIKNDQELEKLKEKFKSEKEKYLKVIKEKRRKLELRKTKTKISELEFLEIWIKRQTYNSVYSEREDFFFSRTINKDGGIPDDQDILDRSLSGDNLRNKFDEFESDFIFYHNNHKVEEFICDYFKYVLELVSMENNTLDLDDLFIYSIIIYNDYRDKKILKRDYVLHYKMLIKILNKADFKISGECKIILSKLNKILDNYFFTKMENKYERD